jgi:hypothetical protein
METSVAPKKAQGLCEKPEKAVTKGQSGDSSDVSGCNLLLHPAYGKLVPFLEHKLSEGRACCELALPPRLHLTWVGYSILFSAQGHMAISYTI